MPNKSYLVWEKTKQWCLAHPDQLAWIMMRDGKFTLTWTPKSDDQKEQKPAFYLKVDAERTP